MGRQEFLTETESYRTVAFDTNTCIYYLQAERPLGQLLIPLIERAAMGDLRILVSAISQMELMVRPYQLADDGMMRQVLRFTERQPGVVLCSITRDVVIEAARLRAHTRLKLPDALVAASARVHSADALIGNDEALRRIGQTTDDAVALIGTETLLPVPRYLHLNDYAED